MSNDMPVTDLKAVTDEWMGICLELIQDPKTTPAESLLITRLGLIGQRSLYKAHAAGMNDTSRIQQKAREDAEDRLKRL